MWVVNPRGQSWMTPERERTAVKFELFFPNSVVTRGGVGLVQIHENSFGRHKMQFYLHMGFLARFFVWNMFLLIFQGVLSGLRSPPIISDFDSVQ